MSAAPRPGGSSATGTPPAAAFADHCTVATEGAIDLAHVDAEFSTLWQRAGQQLGIGPEASMVRACLWNLVLHRAPASGPMDRAADPASALLDEVTLSLPSRVISLRDGASADAAVEARLSVRGVRGPTGAGTVVAEEVALSAPGESGSERFPALVRALLVPDLPVALLWLDGTPHRGRLLNQLAHLSDRILVDTGNPGPLSVLGELSELVRNTPSPVSDLGWNRLTPLRYLLASLFDPPGHPEHLNSLERLELECTLSGRNQGMLLLGWLLARCGYTTHRAVELAVRPPPPQEEYRWQVIRKDRRAAPVTFATKEGTMPGIHDGVLKVTIEAAGQRYILERADAEHVLLSSPQASEQRVALHGWGDADLVVASLGAPRGDPLYREALEAAARLMDQEAWTQ